MIIEVEINKCSDCIHLDHSGAFTEGGSKPICNHEDAFCTARAKQMGCTRYDWKYRVVTTDGPLPDWCPLKTGSQY